MIEEKDENLLYADEIDGYWLQRKLVDYFKETLEIPKIEKRILKALSLEMEIECEISLFEIF